MDFTPRRHQTPAEYVSENRASLVQILRRSSNVYARACIWALLDAGCEDPEILQLERELDVLNRRDQDSVTQPNADIRQDVEQNREMLSRVVRNSSNGFARAAAWAILDHGSDPPSLDQLRHELDVLKQQRGMVDA